jgi:hypothetical protein
VFQKYFQLHLKCYTPSNMSETSFCWPSNLVYIFYMLNDVRRNVKFQSHPSSPISATNLPSSFTKISISSVKALKLPKISYKSAIGNFYDATPPYIQLHFDW